MLTLFGNLDSGNLHKVAMILRYLDRPYERIDVSQAAGDTQHPAFRELNPIGKIPVLRFDDGDVITESNAICVHLCRDTALWPAEARAQTDVLRWLFFEQYSHEQALSVRRYLLRFTADPTAHKAAIAELKPRARHALAVMNNELSDRDWIAGASPTVADYALYPYSRWADESGIDVNDYPNVISWLSRIESQPRFLHCYTEGAVQVRSFPEYFG